MSQDSSISRYYPESISKESRKIPHVKIISTIRQPELSKQQTTYINHFDATTNTTMDSNKRKMPLLTSVIISVLIHAIITNCQPVSTTATASILASDNSNSILANRLNNGHLLATFSTPNQAINITHVTYDPFYDALYLGATNTIYQLNGSDLTVQYEQATGPIFDNPNCGITECNGFEDHMKPTQNINKVLVIDYRHKKLLSCGSTKQGACRRYQLNNIAQKEDLIPMAVAANDDNSSTYAFIAPARYVYDPSTTSSSLSNNNNNNLMLQQQVLYVASTYTKIGQSRELLVPAIGTRTLEDGPNLLKLYENSFLDSARIDINSHLRDYFLVNYLYGFASSNYIYFVTVQKKATSRDFEELGYHTRLARICITDSSYNSYTEVDLKCMPNKRKSSSAQSKSASNQPHQPSDYPLLQDAILVDAGSHLLQSLAQNDQAANGGSSSFLFGGQSTMSAGGGSSSSSDDNKVLLGVFSTARDHTQHPGDHSAICAFSLSQIEDKFNDNIHSCYTGKMQSRNMEYIAGNVQECPKSGQGGNVVNFCHETLKINGTIPIVSEASIQFFNTTLTAITATSHVNQQVKNIYSEQLAGDISINGANQIGAGAKKDQAPQMFGPFGHQQTVGSRQHTVVFAGTSSGHIKKILLNNATNGLEFDDVQLDTNPILSDLHLHASGQQLIAATPYKVMKVPTHNCAQYSSCRECSQSANPYCGWCSLKKSCTTMSECGPPTSSSGNTIDQQQHANVGPNGAPGANPRQPPKWISFDSRGKCIDLHSIVPDKIPMISTGKINLTIDRLPRLPPGHSYKCVFNRSEQTSATPTASGLSCPLPKLMDRQKYIQIEPGKDHAIVDLAVRSSETNRDFLDGKIAFFECQHHTSCQDCLSTNWGCNWCLEENVCLYNTSKCVPASLTSTATAASGQEQQLFQPLSGAASGAKQVVTIGQIASTTMANNQRGSTVIAAASNQLHGRQGSQASNTISRLQQCPNYDQFAHQQQLQQHSTDMPISDATELNSQRDRNIAQQAFKQQARLNRPQVSTLPTSSEHYQQGYSSSPIPLMFDNEQLGHHMLLQHQHQRQQDALFTSTIWTPHLRQQPFLQPTGQGMQPQMFGPQMNEKPLKDFPLLQRASDATKQQQMQPMNQDATVGSTFMYGALLIMTLVVVALLALHVLRSHTNGHHLRIAQQPYGKLVAFREWLARRGRSLAGPHEARCLHHGHLHASECVKCKQSSSSSPENCSSPWPITSAFGSSINNTSGIIGTLRGSALNQQQRPSNSIIVGLNPIARLNGTQQHNNPHHKTISNHIKQQFCFATQASKVSAVMDNFAQQQQQQHPNHVGSSYYASVNYSDGDNFVSSSSAYQPQQPPTADLLGTGYQCHQQQQQSFSTLPQQLFQFGNMNYNTNQTTTRLVWQRGASTNGSPNATGANTGYLIDGGHYMPLSSNSSGNAAATGQTHSGSGSPIYQTIYQ